MPQIDTLPLPDRDELDQALTQQKRVAKTGERQAFLQKRDNLLQRIPPLPEYQPMTIEHRPAVNHLPSDQSLTPRLIFGLIWTTTVWEMLRDNTNLYARSQSNLDPHWYSTTVSELKIFIAITIYMGIYHFPTIHDYWRTDGIAPVAFVVGKMARDRYLLLRRYIHLSNILTEDNETIGAGRWKQAVWYKKLLPFASEIRKNWRLLRTPSSHTAIDECMIKETRHTSHSTMAPGKPIKEGYKLFSIGDEGYLYNYAWYSPLQGLESRPKTKGLGDTSAMVLKLAVDTLPKDTILFMDNYFTCPELAVALRDRGIAVCGTMKPGRKDLPDLLVEMKKEYAKDIPYGVLAAVVQNDVLMVAWQDNNLVLGLTTAYGVREVDDFVSKKRKRPSKTSTNARVVLPAFKENDKDVFEKTFKVPKVFYHYNKHMGEVDRFNALVATYSSQRACNRNWMPLFYWHLDGSLANAFKLYESSISTIRTGQEHQKFLESVVVELFKEGDVYRGRPNPPPIITQPHSLRGNHNWQNLKSIRVCVMCRKDNQDRGFGREISGNRGSAPRTRGGCAVCKVYLCRQGDCVKRFHATIDTLDHKE